MIRETVSSARWMVAASTLVIAVAATATPAAAQSAGDPAYQAFFGATVCNDPAQGTAFRDRCVETFDPSAPEGEQFANISANSESSLTPNQVVVAATNSLTSAQALADTTEARLEALRDEENGKPAARTDKVAGFGPWSVFLNVYGEWFDQSRPAYANERAFDGDRLGGTAGFDYRLGTGARIGIAAAYSRYKMQFDPEPTTGSFTAPVDAGGTRSKTYSVTVFGTFPIGDSAWADISAGAAWSNNHFRRNAVFQTGTLSVSRLVSTTGSADGRQWFASAGAGYDFTDGALSVGPYARLTYARSTIDAYDEVEATTTGLAMSVEKQKATSLAGVLGARASYSIGTSWGVVVPQARLEYEHEFKDDARITVTRFVLDPSNVPLPLVTDAPDRNHFNAGVSLSLVLPGGVMPYVDYEALVGYSNYSLHRLTAGVRIEF